MTSMTNDPALEAVEQARQALQATEERLNARLDALEGDTIQVRREPWMTDAVWRDVRSSFFAHIEAIVGQIYAERGHLG